MPSKMLVANTLSTIKQLTTTASAEQQNNATYCEVYLVRHGETDWNKRGKGETNIPLNETGEKQALQISVKLEAITFSSVFSSDTHRAHKTAHIILGKKNIPITQTPALRERSFGAWEGHSRNAFEAWVKTQPKRDVISQEHYLSHKWNGEFESLREVYTRVANFMIALTSSQHMGAVILCCAHSGVLRAFLCTLDFRSGFSWHVANCALLRLRLDKNGTITLVNHEGCQLMIEQY